MGYCLIKQPDNRYAVYSTYSDTFKLVDATAQEIVDYYVEKAKVDAEESTKRDLEMIDDQPKRFMSWKEAVRGHQRHKENCGSQEFRDSVEKVIERLSGEPKDATTK